MNKPENYPKWAEIKPENKITPKEDLKNNGWEFQSVIGRQHINYQFWLLNQWIEYLDFSQNRVAKYPNKDSLPDATENEALLVYVEDQKVLAFSNGSIWQKIRTNNL